MNLTKLGGVWPRRLTTEEQESLIANPGPTDAATAANPPNRAEIDALAAIEVAEAEYKAAQAAYGRALESRTPRTRITARGELEYLGGAVGSEQVEAARAALDDARENCRRLRVRWTEECLKRARRIEEWRAKHPGK